MTEMLDVQPGESVYDPTCGSGGMLLSCVAHLRKQKKEWRNVKLFGQERNLMTSSIARMNCFLHGIEDFRIERGDTPDRGRSLEPPRPEAVVGRRVARVTRPRLERRQGLVVAPEAVPIAGQPPLAPEPGFEGPGLPAPDGVVSEAIVEPAPADASLGERIQGFVGEGLVPSSPGLLTAAAPGQC